jgi:hypothetical protein
MEHVSLGITIRELRSAMSKQLALSTASHPFLPTYSWYINDEAIPSLCCYCCGISGGDNRRAKVYEELQQVNPFICISCQYTPPSPPRFLFPDPY